ncbi:MAG: trypsin-like peptidase domain-containing protein, partial [Deltaproteobacteria bacterium]|nr:trypsin-like peptidase domain-containing protein [Deltaproteobacteria bacterium]
METSKILTLFVLFALLFCSTSCSADRTSMRKTPIVKVVREYAPVVVNIRTERIVDLKEHPDWGKYGEQLDNFLKEYYGAIYSKGTLSLKSLGSGVILNNEGLIVTNAHVVHRANNIFVVLKDGSVLKSKVVGVSMDVDIAFIKTKLPHPVKEIRFADSGNFMIGETVIAIGNSLGLENSVTVGVLSGIDRTFS